jgi:tetratricopeptide (TPR) repeat protein
MRSRAAAGRPHPVAKLAALGALLSCFAFGARAEAISAGDAQERAQKSILQVEADLPKADRQVKGTGVHGPTAAERVAAGEMLLRAKDYDRAIDELSKVVELYRQGKVSPSANADALFLLAEGYFQSKQYLSGRRHYREIVDSAQKRPYDAYAGRALSRLVDIALRTNDLDSLDWVFARLDKLPATDKSGSLQYARAKALYARRDYARARAGIDSVPAKSEYAHQAQYLLGVLMVKETPPAPPAPAVPARPPALPPGAKAPAAPAGPQPNERFAPAIEQFRKITRLPADSEEHRHVIDLAWMAMGRLFYETDNYLDAAEAYSHVDRTSPEFSTMLYELGWVYVRLGDYQRAQRALEVLAITDPGTLELADGSLLRADLMLRSRQFDKAFMLYQNVQRRFDPIRERVDAFLASTTDPAVYYDKLTSDEMASGETLPPLVIEWAREEAEDERVFSVIDDVTRSRDLIKRSRKLVMKLNAALASPTRIKAFPDLKNALEKTVGLLNKSALARLTLAQGMDDVGGSGAGELGRVRLERKRLMRRMEFLPVTDGDFSRREATGERQWNRVSQTLQRLTLESDQLQALVNGLRRMVKEADRFGVTADPASRERFRLEIEANERQLEAYRQRIQQFRDAVEMGRVQIGFGDQRFVDDDAIRRRFAVVFAREVALAAMGSGGEASYARSIQPLLARADRAEARLEGVKLRFEQQSVELARGLRGQIARESQNIAVYTDRLDGLDQQARLLVGEIAMRNFARVRDRLKNIVLRADVGMVQEAWEVREEHRLRVRDLQRERAREEQNLNDELREVLDDAEEAP